MELKIEHTHLEHGGSGVQLPDTIVVHAMGEYILTDPPRHAVSYLNFAKLSAHSLIAPDGTNYRCREDMEIAWHALDYNINTLGIEFLVPGDHTLATLIQAMNTNYVTEEAYQCGLAQIKTWLHNWPINKIVMHSTLSPERKVDPGAGFPWQRLMKDIGFTNEGVKDERNQQAY